MKIARRALLLGVAGLAITASAAPAFAEGLTLTVWHLASDSPALMNIYKAYEAHSKNTMSFVDMPPAGFESTTMTKWSTGERPDII